MTNCTRLSTRLSTLRCLICIRTARPSCSLDIGAAPGALVFRAQANPSFTGRERDIVNLLMQGMTNRQVARALGIAEGTVKKHLHHVYRKVGVRSRAMLIIDQGGKKR
jgi:DNA-binding CsgD family transcriptional regulator